MTVPALDTTFIGTFAYIQPATSIQLADALPYFHAYQQFPEYVDGVMRIWDTGSQSPAPNNYCDVYVRIRTDGWMMAFIPDDAHQGTACWGTYPWILGNYNNRGDLPWWGHTSLYDGNPTTNATRLGRALAELWAAVKTNSDNPGYAFDYADVGYYDYEHTGSTKIYIFGLTDYNLMDHRYVYFTIPIGTTIQCCYANYGYGNRSSTGWHNYEIINEGTGNEYTIFDVVEAQSNGFLTTDIEPYTFTGGVQNELHFLIGANQNSCSATIIFADG